MGKFRKNKNGGFCGIKKFGMTCWHENESNNIYNAHNIAAYFTNKPYIHTFVNASTSHIVQPSTSHIFQPNIHLSKHTIDRSNVAPTVGYFVGSLDATSPPLS
jgi:hypothetical protein